MNSSSFTVRYSFFFILTFIRGPFLKARFSNIIRRAESRIGAFAHRVMGTT